MAAQLPPKGLDEWPQPMRQRNMPTPHKGGRSSRNQKVEKKESERNRRQHNVDSSSQTSGCQGGCENSLHRPPSPKPEVRKRHKNHKHHHRHHHHHHHKGRKHRKEPHGESFEAPDQDYPDSHHGHTRRHSLQQSEQAGHPFEPSFFPPDVPPAGFVPDDPLAYGFPDPMFDGGFYGPPDMDGNPYGSGGPRAGESLDMGPLGPFDPTDPTAYIDPTDPMNPLGFYNPLDPMNAMWFDPDDPLAWQGYPEEQLEEKNCTPKKISLFVLLIVLTMVLLVSIGLVAGVIPGLVEADDQTDYGDYMDETTAANDENYGGLGSTTESGPEGWSEWTTADCSVTCGIGVVTRTRTCSGSDCKEPEEVEETQCYQGACTCSFYVSNPKTIFTVTEDGVVSRTYTTTGKKKSVDLAYDPLTKSLFWTNELREVVKNDKVLKNLKYKLGGLVVDTKEKLLFIAALQQGVLKTKFSGGDETFLRKDVSLDCETLINIPLDGVLFWANNKKRTLEAVKYDGKDHKVLHKYPQKFGPVVGMTVDLTSKVIYWLHRKDAKIFSMPHDKSSNPKQIFAGTTKYVGEDLVICLKNLFYLDPMTSGGSIWKVSYDGKKREKVSKSAIIKCDSLYLNN